jgi:small conductance mechanosensitive channel
MILAFAVGVVVLYLFSWLLEKLLRVARTPRTLHDIIISISRVVMWVILIAIIFQSIGLPQVALALSSSLAIVGVALGAGANGLVQDVISGLFLARDQDFDTGFRIKSGDIEGIIKRVDIRKVRIEDSKGCIHVVPTSSFDKTSWVVLSRDK